MLAHPRFAESDDRAGADDRIFFAALPDARAKAEIARRVSRVCGDRMTANVFDADRLHVSLCFVATHIDLSPAMAERAHQAASTVRMRPFAAAFNCLMRFSKGAGRCPLVLLGDEGVVGLTALQRSIGIAMRNAGLGHREQPGYMPHVTLLYGTFPIEERTIEPIRWPVRDFVLVHSHRREGRHSYLGRWPLRA